MARNWKRVQPTSARQALELCKEHARETRNLSVERIAERMGLPDHFTLYKWLQTGRIPLVMVPAYEQVCGIDLVTRWMASAADKILITVPTGRKTTAQDVLQLQEVLNKATGAIISFHNGNSTAEETIAAIQTGLEGLAWHRGNVSQHHAPQFDLSQE
ncbi:MAG TPA: hypothetical protein VFW42_10855 [Fluviicoccus sp.]|nr:hypothetical protein [Fluviicoccus sp.]